MQVSGLIISAKVGRQPSEDRAELKHFSTVSPVRYQRNFYGVAERLFRRAAQRVIAKVFSDIGRRHQNSVIGIRFDKAQYAAKARMPFSQKREPDIVEHDRHDLKCQRSKYRHNIWQKPALPAGSRFVYLSVVTFNKCRPSTSTRRCVKLHVQQQTSGIFPAP